MNRLREGYCLVANPFNPASISRVSLEKPDVDVIVFWSKNPSPFLDHLDELDARGFDYYFLYTLNDYPEHLEPGMPSVKERLATFGRLARAIGRERVIWRYDPIVLSDRLTPDRHLKAFDRLADALEDATQRVIVSFLDFYRKTERRLRRIESDAGDAYVRDPFEHPQIGPLVRGLADAADRHGLDIQTCAEDDRVQAMGIQPGKCIDDELIDRVFGTSLPDRKDSGQRGKCRCVASKDIGATDSCLHGCEYCYSTVSADAARARAARHDPEAPILLP
jgi:hypothetical protein